MNKITIAVRSALGLAMLAPTTMLFAQTAPANSDEQLEEVIVTGIRLTQEKALDQKRASTDVVEIVNAEDIGKMPDKNIADSLQRIAGITTSSAGASEGGFDENDRISMRGTNPSLTQTLINGHNVAAGDWFVLNQTGTVGRSVSYTLLPSELVSQVVVHKSSQASLVEGGVAGSVDIITRKPLDSTFTKAFTAEASLGAVYADLPSKTDPQASALFNWRNDDRNFGVMVQGFYERRDLRRDGVELLGYDTIAPTSAIATSNPDLSGVQYPTEMGVAFFTQQRTRKGGLVDVEFKPTDRLDFDLSGFYSNLDAPNYNRNYLLWNTHYIASGAGQAPDAGYVIKDNTLVQANFTGVPNTIYGVYDQISRPDESERASFVNLDVKFSATDNLDFLAQGGISQGDGRTPTQDVSETNPDVGGGGGWTLHGLSSAPDFNLGPTNNTTPTPGGVPVTFGWIFGAQNVDVKDQEDWIKLDGTFKVDSGDWTDFKFGARHETHSRVSLGAYAQGPTFSNPDPSAPNGGTDTGHYPTTFTNYPSDFTTFGGNVPTGIWYWTPEQLAAYDGPGWTNRDPISRAYAAYWFQLHEKTDAAYVQADFKGGNWAANVGLRYVYTGEDITLYDQTTNVTATTPGAVTTSAFGPYVGHQITHNYNNFLPSANLKFDLSSELVARFALAQTMTRPDYSALAAPTSFGSPPQGTTPGGGTTGNPDLKPIRSTNLDAGIEWYFAKASLLSATAYYMDLQNYVSYSSLPLTTLSYSGQYPTGAELNYLLSVPINSKGHVGGLELNYQQAFGEHWGAGATYTYSDGKQTSNVVNNDDRLVGTSKSTYNVNGYYENSHFSARVAWNYRSAYLSGLDRGTAFSEDGIGYLSASLAYNINQIIGLTLDGQNLNNPTLKYYALNETQPRAFYTNGRQYYLNLRIKL